MRKQLSKCTAVVLTVAMFMTAFAFIQPVSAAAKPDMKIANVKWDLKNNKKLTYKQYWYGMGVKKHTVKMTKFKVTNASKKGYKQCTFTLTYNLKVNPTKKQVLKMGTRADTYGLFTEWGFCVVDYQTGMNLGDNNDKNVTSTCKWKHSKYTKVKGSKGSWIRYPKKSVVNVRIVYPSTYKNLAIGAVGASNANINNADAHWEGKIPFSKTTSLYSKKDKNFAHFMRVK